MKNQYPFPDVNFPGKHWWTKWGNIFAEYFYVFHVAKDYLLNAYAACLSKSSEVSKGGSKLYSTSLGIWI